MAIGIAETLIAHGEITELQLCNAFVANYVPSRGCGRGAQAVLDAMEAGRDYEPVAEKYFPGGSYGNGAAKIYSKPMKTKEKRRGGPKKSSDVAKPESVLLRIDQREKQGFSDAASLAGIPLSVWIRERSRLAVRHELEMAGRQVAFISG